jgi:hypothetical protein
VTVSVFECITSKKKLSLVVSITIYYIRIVPYTRVIEYMDSRLFLLC